MNTQHFMVDIETLGRGPDAPVLSVGVVAFQPGVGIQDEWLWVLDTKDQTQRRIDFDTTLWWLRQKPEAQQHWVNPEKRYSTIDCLQAMRPIFSAFGSEVMFWAYSPSFDQIALEGLYNEFKLSIPWKYNQWNDVRTIRNFTKDQSRPEGYYGHNPLIDCKVQIELVERFYKEQGLI